jgi:tetratricopeptide (TPR) repeat protein
MIGIAHEALQIARTIGDRYSEGEALRILGLAYYSTGEVQNMMHFYEQSLMIWREINRPIGLGDALVMIGLGYYLLGDFQTAVTFCEQALGIVREISARIDEVNALTCLGIIAHVQGNQQAARQLLEEALALARSIGAMIMEVWARIDLGHVLIALGEYDQGTGMFQAAVVLCLTLRHAGLLAEARAGLARTFHIQHRLPEALEQVELVLEHLVTGTLDGADSVMRAYLCCYEVLHAADDPRACSLLERAHTELMVQARRLDETAQQMFLENVPWNREVVAAWVALEG